MKKINERWEKDDRWNLTKYNRNVSKIIKK